jgi:hypothetical protein
MCGFLSDDGSAKRVDDPQPPRKDPAAETRKPRDGDEDPREMRVLILVKTGTGTNAKHGAHNRVTVFIAVHQVFIIMSPVACQCSCATFTDTETHLSLSAVHNVSLHQIFISNHTISTQQQ